jgi:hypothetical protein
MKVLAGLFCSVLLLLILCGCTSAQGDSGQNSFYINLNDYPLYVKSGFDSSGITDMPDHFDGSWLVKGPPGGEARIRKGA